MELEPKTQTKKYKKRPYFWYGLILAVIVVIPGYISVDFYKNKYAFIFSKLLMLIIGLLLFIYFFTKDKKSNTPSQVLRDPVRVFMKILLPIFLLVPLIGSLGLIVLFFACLTGGGC